MLAWRTAAVLLCALLTWPPEGDAEEAPSSRELCRSMLEPAGFDGRFEALRVLVRVAGCNLRGLVVDEAMSGVVAPRVRQYARHCFDEQERVYLQQSLRRGALQEASSVDLERCRAALDEFSLMPVLQETR